MGKKIRKTFHFFLTILLIALGGFGMAKLTSLKPEIKKRKPPIPLPIVETIKVKTKSVPIIIKGEGVVHPVKEIKLVPQVAGKVIYLSPSFVNGGSFKQDEVLLKIDPVDYKLALILAKAKVKEAESNLKLIKEDAAAAREEWRMNFKRDSKTKRNPPPLVAKEPQLMAAKAKLEAAKAEFSKAKLNLERTVLKAPFEGRVSQKNVDIGQYVTPGQPIATLYSTEAAEIVIPFDKNELKWFHVPNFTPEDEKGSEATIIANIAGSKLVLKGRVVRAEGMVDEKTRMINVVVRVEKPYLNKPPLAVGLFVQVEIKGRTLKNVAILPRSALHQNNKDENIVWIVNIDGFLHFRKVEVAKFSDDNMVIKNGIRDGDMVVISPLRIATNGMKVRNFLLKEESKS